MRYKASEKREIIDLVERSSLPVRRTLDRLGIPSRPSMAGMSVTGKAVMPPWRIAPAVEGLEPVPGHVRQSILTLALERPELSARELAVLYTERQRYFVSESSVYRL